ncbi:hypothetical protein FBEOM_11864 [Fusarium beomiforme]|uniref:Uncharacterized protein n=1 Tax=Fusarium beomiforme TaxID=44412 RepID=A0A9P5DRC2_9HYPO|nr:hypothetical protein FBEOM_11864 [Fusarium beomiforme]
MSRALAEVDGLFAGLIYLDEKESMTCQRNSKKPIRNHLSLELDAIYNVYEVGLGDNTSNAPHIVHEDTRAREAAWSSIRAIREGMQILWDHFAHISRGMNMAAIDEVRNSYQNARGLCYQGVLAFRYTVAGLRPDVSRLLRTRREHAQGEILAGMRLWRDALEKDNERQAFDALARLLWPQTQNPPYFPDPDQGQKSPQYTDNTLQHGGSASPTPSGHYTNTISPLAGKLAIMPPFDGVQQAQKLYNEQSMHHIFNLPQGTNLGAEPISNDAANFSLALAQSLESFTSSTHDACSFSVAGTQLPMPDTKTYTDALTISDSGSFQSLNFDMLDTMGFAAPGDPMGQPADYNPIEKSLYEPNDRPLPETTTHTSAFQMTYTFEAVKEYIDQNCPFWYQLAGCGLVSKDFASCVLWYQPVQTESIRAQTSAYVQVLSSHKHTLNVESRGIISVAEMFVEWGLLQSIKDAESYMKGLGDILFDDETACQEFCDWIKARRNDGMKKTFLCPECPHRDNFQGNLSRHRRQEREGSKTMKVWRKQQRQSQDGAPWDSTARREMTTGKGKQWPRKSM